jgi:hypothetical protein
MAPAYAALCARSGADLATAGTHASIITALDREFNGEEGRTSTAQGHARTIFKRALERLPSSARTLAPLGVGAGQDDYGRGQRLTERVDGEITKLAGPGVCILSPGRSFIP